MVILLFLLGIGGLVPVGKIPLLRNLVYAMGYSIDEAQGISFFKALFSWNEHNKMVRGEIPDPDEVNIFGAQGGSFNSTQAQAENKLIDIRSVNAALAKRGQKGDYITGVYDDPTAAARGENSRNSVQRDKSAVRLTKDGVSAQTQANAAQNTEVFFGEDANAVLRDKNDAFNSVNTLKKVAKLPIAGVSKGTDWFDRAVERAAYGQVDLSEFLKKNDRSSTSIAQIGSIARVGDTRATRDMYWAWMMGRAAHRTPQVLLKKTLASASFDGAEMPRSVFTSSGFGGVAINADDVLADMTNVQNYLDQDKNCEDAVERAGQQMPTSQTMYDQINQLSGAFPATCGARPGNYLNLLQAVENSCRQMKSAWEAAQRTCGTLSLVLNNNQCRFENLHAHYTAFDEYCKSLEDACAALEDPEEQALCVQLAHDQSSHEDFPDGVGGSYNAERLEGDDGEVLGQLYDERGRLNTDYFPGVDWGESIRVRTVRW